MPPPPNALPPHDVPPSLALYPPLQMRTNVDPASVTARHWLGEGNPPPGGGGAMLFGAILRVDWAKAVAAGIKIVAAIAVIVSSFFILIFLVFCPVSKWPRFKAGH